jgi:hypothetical protein
LANKVVERDESMTGDDSVYFRSKPSAEEVRVALSARFPLWERLTEFIETRYQISGRWSSWGPAEFGWGLRYRARGRALVALYPHQDRILAQVVLGKAQAERALDLGLGEETARLLREAPQLRDGRWLSIPVLHPRDAEDVERLLLVKTHPARSDE